MSENANQKNRWNRLRRNRPKWARLIEEAFANPIQGSEISYRLGLKARASARRFKAAMKMGMEGGVAL